MNPIFDNFLLSIGAMKSGTSWLYEILKLYPEIDTTPIKEVHYLWELYGDFKMLTRPERERTLQVHLQGMLAGAGPRELDEKLNWIRAYLSDPIDDVWFANLFMHRHEKRYAAEFSNMVAMLPAPAWQHVRGFARNVRLLYTIREPVARLWSHARYHARVTGDLSSLQNYDRNECANFLFRNGCIATGRYSETIKMLKENFNPSEYRILSYCEIAQNPGRLIATLESFLELNPIGHSTQGINTIHNATPAFPPPPAFLEAAIPIAADEIGKLLRLNFEIPESWQKVY